MNNNIWKSFHRHTSTGDYYSDYVPSANYEKNVKQNYYNSKDIIYLNRNDNQNKDNIKDILIKRKSTRDFNFNVSINLLELSDILIWSYSTVINNGLFKNTVPSAGARYPIEIHIINNNVEGLKKGIYHYNQKKSYLELTNDTKMPYEDITNLCLNQSFIYNSSAVICLCADFTRTISKYGDRGYRYVFIDAGHIGQNLYLMAAKNNIGIVGIGGFKDIKLKNILSLPASEYPIYLFAIGRELESK